MNYSHFQHRHNFAVWCAARAVQRKFAKTPVLKEALENSGVAEFVSQNEDKTISQKDFDKLHADWCDSILQTWKNKNVNGSSYGRAAKLIAVYIKSMTIVRNGQSSLSEAAHPPIDRMILHNISKDKAITHPNRLKWKAVNWTELEKIEYLNLINDFRKVFHGKPFWHLEQYWPITNE